MLVRPKGNCSSGRKESWAYERLKRRAGILTMSTASLFRRGTIRQVTCSHGRRASNPQIYAYSRNPSIGNTTGRILGFLTRPNECQDSAQYMCVRGEANSSGATPTLGTISPADSLADYSLLPGQQGGGGGDGGIKSIWVIKKLYKRQSRSALLVVITRVTTDGLIAPSLECTLEFLMYTARPIRPRHLDPVSWRSLGGFCVRPWPSRVQPKAQAVQQYREYSMMSCRLLVGTGGEAGLVANV